jgi:hypothetical protein
MDYTLIRAVAGNERLVIVSEALFDRIVDLASQNMSRERLGDWVNSGFNRDCLPIALAQQLVREAEDLEEAVDNPSGIVGMHRATSI